MIKAHQQTNQFITRNVLMGILQVIQSILQILGFEESSSGMQSEIIIRLSDGIVFIDCQLIGPYSLEKGIIVCRQNGQVNQFKKLDIIKLADFFSKIDPTRICKLRIIIRKIQLVQNCKFRDGHPQEISQFFYNTKGDTHQKTIQDKKTNQKPKILSEPEKAQKSVIPNQSSQPVNNMQIIHKEVKKKKDFIKIEDDVQEPNNTCKNKQSMIEEQEDDGFESILTTKEVMQGKQGFFLGRLIRLKLGTKQTKEGPITILCLGFIDKKHEVLRVSIVGRLAIKQASKLKKGRCYYVSGFDFFRTDKMQYSQLKLKEKEAKIVEAAEQTKSQKYPQEYYHWDHQNTKVDTENVDVIGIIDQIQQKATYPQTGVNQHRENREVIRIIVRNTLKSCKISFWAQQIHSLFLLKLKRHEQIIFQDIKKKKNMFLDFTVESNLVRLDQNPNLKKQFCDLIPERQQENQPKSIKELNMLYEKYPNNSKTRIIQLFLSSVDEAKIIYKICSNCKKKVETQLLQCRQCSTNQFNFKYNCQIQLIDYTGTVSCVLFDQIAIKIFGKTATEINQLTLEQVHQLIRSCLFKEYEFGIQNKNLRLIIRNLNEKSLEQIAMENVGKIKKILQIE